MSAVSRLNAVDTVTPPMWAPSMLATPEQVRALLAGDDLDPTTREHLRHHLAAQESLEAPPEAPPVDPFAGVDQANYAWDEAM